MTMENWRLSRIEEELERLDFTVDTESNPCVKDTKENNSPQIDNDQEIYCKIIIHKAYKKTSLDDEAERGVKKITGKYDSVGKVKPSLENFSQNINEKEPPPDAGFGEGTCLEGVAGEPCQDAPVPLVTENYVEVYRPPDWVNRHIYAPKHPVNGHKEQSESTQEYGQNNSFNLTYTQEQSIQPPPNRSDESHTTGQPVKHVETVKTIETVTIKDSTRPVEVYRATKSHYNTTESFRQSLPNKQMDINTSKELHVPADQSSTTNGTYGQTTPYISNVDPCRSPGLKRPAETQRLPETNQPTDNRTVTAVTMSEEIEPPLPSPPPASVPMEYIDSTPPAPVHQPESLTEHDLFQVEMFFRSHKTDVYVCQCLANLFFGSVKNSCPGDSQTPDQWVCVKSGIPVLVLDSGESRRHRKLNIILAEKGTGFILWKDSVNHLTNYKAPHVGFHTLHLSTDHTKMAGLSFDDPTSAAEFLRKLMTLTSNPNDEVLNLSHASKGRTKKDHKNKNKAKSKYKPPSKADISQPCCFTHLTKLDHSDGIEMLTTSPEVRKRAATLPREGTTPLATDFIPPMSDC